LMDASFVGSIAMGRTSWTSIVQQSAFVLSWTGIHIAVPRQKRMTGRKTRIFSLTTSRFCVSQTMKCMRAWRRCLRGFNVSGPYAAGQS
jgi:hypothetical protein